MAKKYKTGVFGGSFDPVHKGHIGLAEFILGKKIVDKIIFLPSACPPHKQKAAASFSHRLKMLEIAVGDYPAMEVSPVEEELSHPSYTINSLRTLALRQPEAELFFILGADSLLDLSNWYKYEEILNIAKMIVVSRPGISEQECLRAIRGLPGNLVANYDQTLWSKEEGGLAALWYLRSFKMEFSSTDIRIHLGSGVSPQGLEAEVLSYIERYDLYGVKPK